MAERMLSTEIKISGHEESVAQIKSVSEAYRELRDVLRQVNTEMEKLGVLLGKEPS